jgi:hypothetical protein
MFPIGHHSCAEASSGSYTLQRARRSACHSWLIIREFLYAQQNKVNISYSLNTSRGTSALSALSTTLTRVCQQHADITKPIGDFESFLSQLRDLARSKAPQEYGALTTDAEHAFIKVKTYTDDITNQAGVTMGPGLPQAWGLFLKVVDVRVVDTNRCDE